jgi:D-alanyl-D-alanine carboxypeptidase
MNNTYFPAENHLSGNFAHGYFDVNQDGIFTEVEDYTSQSPYAIWAAGGIVSTLDDLLIWSDELFFGSLLNDELQIKRLTIDIPIAGAPAGVYYGLGIADLFSAIGHTGAVAGYSTILFKYQNTTIIAFGNGYETAGDNGLIAEDLFEKIKSALFE